ncbi:oxidoreductase [Geobacillus thermoleovorans]|uniref:Oxidoreductase n=2 Tax=Geobacillus TaxID=129337 RepID=Q5KYQ4_GEOKA|nr:MULTISPECIES: Gfo/Idh/MocA family oxidoreductase [Geobacillus]KZE96995.1 scyllo-inositol 2-dehydrogenase (NAD(+)) [Geobacillus stearothermophilus]AMV11074.1 oxidoreductase [Geobacillus thermoleovorans]KLR73191.1 oxidoreductase [Geobacillus sp. T6]MED4971783.1 Gfo/Idh/MocA family oxidoreductase [Geobacillus thermoleovorans]OKO89857.1 Myo-inositol 2-dehydrogenase 1 [Geobacillus proteiniphilus]
MTVRCAVLGLGRLGHHHAKNLATHQVSGAKLVSVVDPLGERAEQFAREYGIEHWTKNPDDVFEDPTIDAVVIVTPTSTHAEMIAKAAKNGKAIFVEKPLTQSLEEADDIIQTIQETGVICQVGFMRRFDPAYAEAKRRIEAGDIGKPIYFKGITRDAGSPPAEFIQHSGRVFLDVSIHDYDIARYLMGAEITSVSAHGRVLLHSFMKEFKDVDQAITYVHFDSGAAGDIEASRNSPYGHDIRTEIIGTEGSLFIGTLRNQNVTLLNSKGSTYEIIPDFQTRFNDAYRLELVHFIECVQNRQTPKVTEIDGKVNLKIAIAATESFDSGKTVWLEGHVAEQTR